MKLLLAAKTTEGRYLSVVFILFLLLAAMTFIVWKHPDMPDLRAIVSSRITGLLVGAALPDVSLSC